MAANTSVGKCNTHPNGVTAERPAAEVAALSLLKNVGMQLQCIRVAVWGAVNVLAALDCKLKRMKETEKDKNCVKEVKKKWMAGPPSNSDLRTDLMNVR